MNDITIDFRGVKIPVSVELDETIADFVKMKVREVIKSPEFEDIIGRSIVWFTSKISNQIRDQVNRIIKEELEKRSSGWKVDIKFSAEEEVET